MIVKLKNYFRGGGMARTVFYSAAYNFFGKVILTIFNTFSFIIIVKHLAVSDYGQYIFYLNAVYFITLLLDFGAAEVMLRYVPEYLEKKEFSLIKGLLKRFFMIITCGGLISIFVVFFLFKVFSTLSPGVRISAALLLYIVIFGWLRIITFVLGNILNAFFYQIYKISFEILISIIKFLFILILLKRGFGPWHLILLYAFFDLFITVCFYVRIRKALLGVAPLEDKETFSRMQKFGINEYFYKLFWFFTDNRFDICILGFILGATEVGYFAFAASITNLLIDWSPGFIIRPVVAPLFIKEYANNKNVEKIKYLFQLHNKFLVFIILPIFLFMAILLDKIIIYVFDPKYLPSTNVFLIFIIAMFFSNMIIPIRNILVLMERTDISNLTNLVAIPHVLLVFLMAKIGGINGAALAFCFSVFTILVINFIFVKKIFPLKLPWKAFTKIAINTYIAGLVLFLIKRQITGKESLILALVLGFLLYFYLAYKNKSFDESERALFNRAIKFKIWNF